MADCPLADDCPEFSERISGMGCQHYGDRGGKEWCNHYGQPIEDLKTQPVKSGEEVVIDVVDMHESGAGVGRTEDGFIVMVDGVLPEARARVEITRVHSNHARAEELELLPMDPDEDDANEEGAASGDDGDDGDAVADESGSDDGDDGGPERERLGSRDNFWGS
ncbi:TRAM domain-containing protein [Natrinema versiforme]|uniref:Deoxyribonuclease/rho motif-related TRAM n=1 Tax=Natrinema versiforme JCM 10478 TaxID=1227496 RepID=L9Y660_9EURY|nr:TRAM domain-containing protein [Natrinema versiforme]ELY68403.1 deoxyribonuclease/rho motif-related TRAM [Natrinema versiforme JCM 10478]